METLTVERDGGVVTVTLNRRERRNALTPTMFAELGDVFTEIGRRADDRVVVVTGAGRDFCIGADLTARIDHHARFMRRVNDAALALHRMPQPTIAKVNGIAVGAGCNLALGCDLVVASEEARFSEIFARRGLSLDFGGSWLLPRLVGLHRAKELAFFADVISAADALAMGLINRVVPAAELDGFVAGWAARLAAGPPLALAMTKRLLNDASGSSLDEALEQEARCSSANVGTEDLKEAMRAFKEQRDPRFEGR
jgi:2-(1,2-epoxy-1,2-dihydrophenyl)acetyl-CoA isomerase